MYYSSQQTEQNGVLKGKVLTNWRIGLNQLIWGRKGTKYLSIFKTV